MTNEQLIKAEVTKSLQLGKRAYWLSLVLFATLCIYLAYFEYPESGHTLSLVFMIMAPFVGITSMSGFLNLRDRYNNYRRSV